MLLQACCIFGQHGDVTYRGGRGRVIDTVPITHQFNSIYFNSIQFHSINSIEFKISGERDAQGIHLLNHLLNHFQLYVRSALNTLKDQSKVVQLKLSIRGVIGGTLALSVGQTTILSLSIETEPLTSKPPIILQFKY